ncbi:MULTISPECIES: IS110 family transposase [unclassified Frankia]|uniref:IS110 family transposase n=1 Tax=unclassified Frankia TaxID=2632575 RepID=UPI002025073B
MPGPLRHRGDRRWGGGRPLGRGPPASTGADAGAGRRLSLTERLAEIPGIGPTAAQAIIAEVGVDASRFPTPGHLAAWAGLAPKDRESAGRAKPARTGKGNRYLAAVLGRAVMSVAATQTFYGFRYRRFSRLGRARARRSCRSAGQAGGSSLLWLRSSRLLVVVVQPRGGPSEAADGGLPCVASPRGWN